MEYGVELIIERVCVILFAKLLYIWNLLDNFWHKYQFSQNRPKISHTRNKSVILILESGNIVTTASTTSSPWTLSLKIFDCLGIRYFLIEKFQMIVCTHYTVGWICIIFLILARFFEQYSYNNLLPDSDKMQINNITCCYSHLL